MPNRARNHAMPSRPQPDIADLAEQITALRERIVMMVYEGKPTRGQSELLFRLLAALRAAKASGAAEPQRPSGSSGMRRPALPEAWRSR